MTARPMELSVVCSQQVQKTAAMWVSDTVPWTVDATKPFADEVNFGRLCSTLNIYAVCELCHFAEGVVGSVVDHTKTPEELGYRARMQIYLRLKKQTKAVEDRVSSSLNVKLSSEEQLLLRKLRANTIPNLGPDDMCPLCTRTQPTGDTENSIRRGANQANQSSAAGPGQSTTAAGSPPPHQNIYRPEVGVQCGNAARIDEAPIDISFGSGGRFRDVPRKAYGGTPQDFPPPSSMGGSKFIDFDDTVVDLKGQLEATQRERDQLRMELREVTRQKTELEHWKMQHRCEVSADVAKIKQQMETLQCNLRDVMRGREDAFLLLQQRRSTGSMYGDTPLQYAPFATSLPSLDIPTQDPHKLLAKDFTSLRNSTVEDAPNANSLKLPQANQNDGMSPHQQHDTFTGTQGVELQMRPSGAAAGAKANTDIIGGDQPVGHCMLRIQSLSGEPFHVKRKIDSYVRNRKNVFALMSLDDVVTDEIYVDELEVCRVNGNQELYLATSSHSWSLFMTGNERQRWVHWLYALNPWLSATQNTTGIPASH